MNHPHEDRLLLLAYGELPEAEAAELETHLVWCAGCREALERLERARVALDWRPVRQRPVRWVAAGLAAAAVLVVVLMLRPRPETSTLSLTLPRYTAPGLASIDSVLTRLEQEKPYAIP